jgi:hypothetical protein
MRDRDWLIVHCNTNLGGQHQGCVSVLPYPPVSRSGRVTLWPLQQTINSRWRWRSAANPRLPWWIALLVILAALLAVLIACRWGLSCDPSCENKRAPVVISSEQTVDAGPYRVTDIGDGTAQLQLDIAVSWSVSRS